MQVPTLRSRHSHTAGGLRNNLIVALKAPHNKYCYALSQWIKKQNRKSDLLFKAETDTSAALPRIPQMTLCKSLAEARRCFPLKSSSSGRPEGGQCCQRQRFPPCPHLGQGGPRGSPRWHHSCKAPRQKRTRTWVLWPGTCRKYWAGNSSLYCGFTTDTGYECFIRKGLSLILCLPLLWKRLLDGIVWVSSAGLTHWNM